ncbi:hypothetical protein IJM86_08170 [bacterium]|nr:hypothetical protein [bacterium]
MENVAKQEPTYANITIKNGIPFLDFPGNYLCLYSFNERTDIHYKEMTIDDFEDEQGNEIKASSIDELVQAANFINKIRLVYKKQKDRL